MPITTWGLLKPGVILPEEAMINFSRALLTLNPKHCRCKIPGCKFVNEHGVNTMRLNKSY